MIFKRPSSLQRRLQLLIGLGAGCVVLSMGLIWLVYNATASRDGLQRHLMVQGSLLAAIARPAISFSDPIMAREILVTFQQDPEIIRSALFTADGRLFSSYQPGSKDADVPVLRPEGSYAEKGHLLVYHAIRLKGDVLGTAMVESDLRSLHDNMRTGSIVVGIAMILSLLLAYLFSLRLQRQIASPIMELAKLMRKVGLEQDYKLRMPAGGAYKEIADLHDGFNAMTGQIEHSFALIEDQRNTLIEQEKRFRLLVESIPLPVGVSRKSDGKILFVNQEALRFFQFEDAAPESLSTLLVQGPEAREELQSELARQGSLSNREVTVHKRDGTEVTMALSTQPMAFAGEDALLNVLFDISERKMIQDALARNNEELELRVATRTEQLRLAKEDADQANRDKSRFLASASHDLRQPLQALTLFLGSLEFTLTSDNQRDLLAQAQKSNQALSDLFNALMDVSRLASGSIEAEITTIKLAPLLMDLAEEWAPVAGEKGLDFRLHSCAHISVKTDPILLSRLLRNLISNAIRYTNKGGILLGCRRHGNDVRISIWDTGLGIEDGEMRNIFDEFYQVENPERDRDKGLGLGLSIVKGLAGLLKHRIYVRSHPGRGSCFALDAPMLASPDEQTATVQPQPVDLSEKLALLIDDDVQLLRAMQGSLQDRHCTCILAEDASDAVAQLNDAKACPDFIIADYRLREGKTGIEAVQQIRTLLLRHIPAIIVTGDTAQHVAVEASQADCLLVHKPINIKRLLQLLEASLQRPIDAAP